MLSRIAWNQAWMNLWSFKGAHFPMGNFKILIYLVRIYGTVSWIEDDNKFNILFCKHYKTLYEYPCFGRTRLRHTLKYIQVVAMLSFSQCFKLLYIQIYINNSVIFGTPHFCLICSDDFSSHFKNFLLQQLATWLSSKIWKFIF